MSYPSARVTTMDIGSIALRKHHVAGLLEVDITETQAWLREKRCGDSGVSLFAWIVKQVGTAVADVDKKRRQEIR